MSLFIELINALNDCYFYSTFDIIDTGLSGGAVFGIVLLVFAIIYGGLFAFYWFVYRKRQTQYFTST